MFPHRRFLGITCARPQLIEHAGTPDVAIVDIRMPGGGGVRVAKQLRATVPETRVLAHSALSDHATVVQMLEHGAVGYLLKGTSPAEIRSAVRRTAGGQETLSPEVLSLLVRDLASRLHGRQENRHEHANDGDDDEQFDEGETG